MIRFVFLNVFIVLYSIAMCLWGLTLFAFTGSNRKVHFLVGVPWAKGILAVCGIRVSASGKRNADRGVPRIYMCNHQSYFDILALLAHLPVDFKFIMKQELMQIPLLGPTMRRAGYIGIERSDPRKAIKSLQQAAARIRAGASVLIFPEGTRSVDGRLLPFKKGGFNLALKARCDIVPVTIVGSHRIVPKGSLKINRGSFRMRIGQPVAVEGFSRHNVDELMQAVREVMLRELNQEESRETVGS